RYLVLTHLANGARSSGDANVEQVRTGLADLFPRFPAQRLPQPIDEQRTIYALDLQALGWDAEKRWPEVLQKYPYGLTYDKHTRPAVRELAREVAEMMDEELPWLRADWFLVAASRPPLYGTLTQLPADASYRTEALDAVRNRYQQDLTLADLAVE